MFNHFEGLVEPQRNEPLHNKVLDITNNFLYPIIIVKYMEKDLDIMNYLDIADKFYQSLCPLLY